MKTPAVGVFFCSTRWVASMKPSDSRGSDAIASIRPM
jgi:hypothetical protein